MFYVLIFISPNLFSISKRLTSEQHVIGRNMKRLVIIPILFIICLTIASEEKKDPPGFSFSLLAGPHYGGIIDNKKADAVTSATKWGARAGVSGEFCIKRHYLDVGLEYLYFTQGLSFDSVFHGTRTLSFHQLRLPVMYNFHFLKKNRAYPMLTAGIGPYLGVLLFQDAVESGSLPSYAMKNAEVGIRLACCYFPFIVSGHFPMGVFFDFYRGFSPFYEDQYHSFSKNNMTGNLSTLTLGLIFKYRL